MKVHKAFCLFEQSGTWKNEFRKLGIDAEDYDILDDFGETDHVIDLFGEIEKAYSGAPSLFDEIGSDDLAVAFFPCTRFEAVIPLAFRGEQLQQKAWTDARKLEYSMQLHGELHELYVLICKLFAIANRGGWRLIVENPASPIHYLTQYFPVKPKIVDQDRTANGDYFKKPTQYWFVNCEPEQNMFFEPLEERAVLKVERCATEEGKNRKVRRSLMHPQYARRFIKQFILDAEAI